MSSSRGNRNTWEPTSTATGSPRTSRVPKLENETNIASATTATTRPANGGGSRSQSRSIPPAASHPVSASQAAAPAPTPIAQCTRARVVSPSRRPAQSLPSTSAAHSSRGKATKPAVRKVEAGGAMSVGPIGHRRPVLDRSARLVYRGRAAPSRRSERFLQDAGQLADDAAPEGENAE